MTRVRDNIRALRLIAILASACGEARLPLFELMTRDAGSLPKPLVAGLRGHFRLDETSPGSPVLDSSSQNAHGIPINGPEPSLITAPLQFANPRSLAFDGSRRQQVDLTGQYPRVNGPQTLAVWFRYLAKDVGSLSQDVIGIGDITTSAVQFGIRRDTPESNVVTFAAWRRIGVHLCEGPLPSQDAWHHVAYTFDGTLHACYVDGVLVGSSTTPAQTGPTTVARLANSPGQGEPFTGWLDDARIYDRPLSAAEVAHLAAGLP
ncbi:MAG: LamG domain-containing protein [Deltaproteobacteria bacterium]|nr:LamG domain-containing protein [Deltaproteobacteria bacterium]